MADRHPSETALIGAYKRALRRLDINTAEPDRCWILRAGESDRIRTGNSIVSIASVIWKTYTHNKLPVPGRYERTCGNARCFNPLHLRTFVPPRVKENLPSETFKELRIEYGLENVPLHVLAAKYHLSIPDLREMLAARYLREVDKEVIRQQYRLGVKQIELAKTYGVSQPAVYGILRKASAASMAREYAHTCQNYNTTSYCLPASLEDTCTSVMHLWRKQVSDDPPSERRPFGL